MLLMPYELEHKLLCTTSFMLGKSVCRCPWIYPDNSAGWRQVLGAVTPMERLSKNTADLTSTDMHAPKGASSYEAGPRHVYQQSNAGCSRPRRTSIVATAHELLGRLSRGRLSSASAPSPVELGETGDADGSSR
jgi:hypothetical protein